MSRNMGQQRRSRVIKLTIPRKRQPSLSSETSINLSDENRYSAVEELSESDEDDEGHVAAAETEYLVSTANAARKRSSVPPRPLQDFSSDADEEGDDVDAEDDVYEDENESWGGLASEVDETAGADPPAHESLLSCAERRVRFANLPGHASNDSDSIDTDEELQNGFFTDIFLEKSELDRGFRCELEKDDDSSSNNSSFWDHGYTYPIYEAEEFVGFDARQDTPNATPMASQQPSTLSSPVSKGVVDSFDGCETNGDTTDEEEAPPQITRRPQVQRRSVDSAVGSDMQRVVLSKHSQPHRGRFIIEDSDKPVAVVHPTTRKMMIFTPRRSRQFDLAPESFDIGAMDFVRSPDMLQTTGSSPLFSNSASLMLSAMFSGNTFGDFMNTQPFGPAEAFYSSEIAFDIGDDSDEFDIDDQEDDAEQNLDINDFITFHNDSSDDEDNDDEKVFDPSQQTDNVSPLTRPETAASTANALLSDASTTGAHQLFNHFDNNPNAVGAFRRNQEQQQLISNGKASHESLAFSNPLHYGTLRGIRSDCLQSVTTPMTPVRRQKRSSIIRMSGIPDVNSSPLQAMSQKRKVGSSVSGAHKFHKKQRSDTDYSVG